MSVLGLYAQTDKWQTGDRILLEFHGVTWGGNVDPLYNDMHIAFVAFTCGRNIAATAALKVFITPPGSDTGITITINPGTANEEQGNIDVNLYTE